MSDTQAGFWVGFLLRGTSYYTPPLLLLLLYFLGRSKNHLARLAASRQSHRQGSRWHFFVGVPLLLLLQLALLFFGRPESHIPWLAASYQTFPQDCE